MDIAHHVKTRNETEDPKPVVCQAFSEKESFGVRQRASQVNPTSIGLSAENELGDVRVFDHLTPMKQNLLLEAKKFKEQHHYRFCC